MRGEYRKSIMLQIFIIKYYYMLHQINMQDLKFY